MKSRDQVSSWPHEGKINLEMGNSDVVKIRIAAAATVFWKLESKGNEEMDQLTIMLR